MKYRVGDKVLISSEVRTDNYVSFMNKWLGEVMTIRTTRPHGYYMEEDAHEGAFHNGWFWEECMIEGLAEEESTVDISSEELMNVLNI